MEWGGGGGDMDSQYKLLSELLSDQAAFITSPNTSLANYWGGIAPPLPPSVYGPAKMHREILYLEQGFPNQGSGPQVGSERSVCGVAKRSWGRWGR